jgi:Ni,Fe-hydrogenase III small subunit/ferredoxin
VLEIFLERLRQGARTGTFPDALPDLPARFRGRPFIDAERCPAAAGDGCRCCLEVCPAHAIYREEDGLSLDMGLCSFCGECARACPKGAIIFTVDWRLASTVREALIVRPARYCAPSLPGGGLPASHGLPGGTDGRRYVLPESPITPVTARDRSLARSFRLRQVTAAGCGACEADLNVLTTLVYDMGRFGIDFVASPRHADAIALTGPVSRNMRQALEDCRAAMPSPSCVIAVGACAISGGLFRDPAASVALSAGIQEGAPPHMPVDLFIPGCPPHPCTTLDALLRFLGKKTPPLD